MGHVSVSVAELAGGGPGLFQSKLFHYLNPLYKFDYQ